MAVENRRTVPKYLAVVLAACSISAVVLTGCQSQQAKPPIVSATPQQYQQQVGAGVSNFEAYKAAHSHQ